MFKKNKIATVNKHIPGHGLAKTDSHFKTPIIKTKKKELIKKDFKPFKKCNSLFAMTAHVVYSAYDNVNVATHSKNIIKGVIRNHINFKGILISDDISMKSLKHTIENNALQALKALLNHEQRDSITVKQFCDEIGDQKLDKIIADCEEL